MDRRARRADGGNAGTAATLRPRVYVCERSTRYRNIRGQTASTVRNDAGMVHVVECSRGEQGPKEVVDCLPLSPPTPGPNGLSPRRRHRACFSASLAAM
eukprot:3928059-Pleurochrysis_carterae.AAC.1